MSEEAVNTEEVASEEVADNKGIILDDSAPELKEGEYYLAEGIKGVGDTPEFFDAKRFKSVSDQAKSYLELEKKFGSFKGSPKDGYNLPDGVEKDDALVEMLTEFATESNMSQDGFDKAFDMLVAQSSASESANQEVELAKLGDNAPQRIKTVEGYLKNNLPAEEYDRLKGAVNTADAVELIEKLIHVAAPPKLPIDGGEHPEGLTMSDIEAEMYKKDEHGNLLRSVNRDHEAKIQKMLREFAGDGDHHQVIG